MNLESDRTAQGLFGWPGAGVSQSLVEVLGVPSDVGNGIASGVRFGPEAIRAASLRLPHPGIAGVDRGDVAGVHTCDWSEVLARAQRAVEDIVGRGAIPLLLGGDHAVSYAAVAALRGRGPLNIVWFDAHTDFCAWAGGDWHNHKQVLRRISGLAHVGRIVQIGHRGITYFDESQQSPQMQVVTANAAPSLSVRALLDFLPADEPVYVSVDI
ncbi:MAG: arginase family protein, partial [Lysobacter sp.]